MILKLSHTFDLRAPVTAMPEIYDINNDGKSELIIVTDKINVFDPISFRPVSRGKFSLGAPSASTPSFFEMTSGWKAVFIGCDNDGEKEIIAAADRIYVFKKNGLSLKGFPADCLSPFWASPVVADINNDRGKEIIACDYKGNLNLFDLEGKRIHSQKIGRRIVSTPLLKDIDDDGFQELVISTFEGKIVI